MLSPVIKRCPHCGDTEEGYSYEVTLKYIQHRGWVDHEDDSTDEDIMDMGRAYRCNACNKAVSPPPPTPGWAVLDEESGGWEPLPEGAVMSLTRFYRHTPREV